MYGDTEDGAREDIAAAADEFAQPRPIGRTPAFDIARPNHQIGVLGQREELWQVDGIVREIGVHLEDEVVALLDGVMEASDIRGSQAHLAGAMQHVNGAIARGQFVGDFAGAIGRIIVDDKEVG